MAASRNRRSAGRGKLHFQIKQGGNSHERHTENPTHTHSDGIVHPAQCTYGVPGQAWKFDERNGRNGACHRRGAKLDLRCRVGVAHNGVIPLTSDPSNERYSDTAIFITDYLSHIIRRRADLRDQRVLDSIFQIAQSRFAIMDGGGYIATVGKFIDERGLLFSNASYLPWRMR